MPAYNFMAQFREPILSGRKKHTIRAFRKRSTKPGERIVLYTGMRTKHCSKIAETACTRVQHITIGPRGAIAIDGELLGADEKERLAYADGFDGFEEMMYFWEGRLPFDGEIIHWKPLPR
jgi:hypothetical protein